MTTSLSAEPWRGLAPEVADLIEPELPAVTEEILSTIGREVPEYARPFEGSFGRGVQTGVTEALRQFVALIRNPDAGRSPGRDVYVALGRGELSQGRALDALQSAYRLGARVAWRRISAAGRRADLDPETLSLLAESIFAYIDELSADSVEGYTAAQSELQGERLRRERELVSAMLSQPPKSEDELNAAGTTARWRIPATAAALACAEQDLTAISHRLPADVISAPIGGLGCIVVPDVGGPGRLARLTQAVDGRTAALGPGVPPRELGSDSWGMAKSALAASGLGSLPSTGLIRSQDHLVDLVLFEGRDLLERLSSDSLEPFAGLTARSQARMRETTLAFLRHRGNAAEMARSLHVHPQTARYRVARLRELFGERLDDPDERFGLELALRADRAGNAA